MVMENDGRTLAQAEIDAMLKALSSHAPASQAVEPVVVNTQPSMAPEENTAQFNISPGDLLSDPVTPQSTLGAFKSMEGDSAEHTSPLDNAALTLLTERVDGIEKVLKRLVKLEDQIAQLKSANKQRARDYTDMTKQLKKISAQINTIVQGLQNTPAYDAHRKFLCDSCGTEGNVAINIRCSQCGKDNWLGWWP